jgi:AcrR family transcriptional regulator
MTGRTVRAERVNETRELILTAAERLFAENGVVVVSNRQVSEAAGQGNNAAVGYHFGTKEDLVRAIVQSHTARMERVRLRLLAEHGDSADLRDWVACLVRPVTDHLDTLGSPSWYARFAAQVMTDPVLREIVIDDALTAPSLQRALDGLNRCLATLPLPVRLDRNNMARHLIVHTCAEYERALATGEAPAQSSWHGMATGLVDAIVGLLTAPVTRP